MQHSRSGGDRGNAGPSSGGGTAEESGRRDQGQPIEPSVGKQDVLPAGLLRGYSGTGDLSESTMLEVFASLVRRRFTGRLRLELARSRRDLHLEQGVVVQIGSNVNRDQIGAYLVDEGALTEDERAKVLVLSRQQGLRFGEAVVRLGLLDRDGMDRWLRTNHLRQARDLLATTHGSWRIDRDSKPNFAKGRAKLLPASLISPELLERMDTEAAAARLQVLGDLQLQLVDDAGLLSDRVPAVPPWLELTNTLRQPTTIGELIGAFPENPTKVMAAVFLMILLGAVGGVEQPKPEPEEVPEARHDPPVEPAPVVQPPRPGPPTRQPVQGAAPTKPTASVDESQAPEGASLSNSSLEARTRPQHESFMAAGLSALQAEQYADAEKAYQKAWELLPGDVEACSYLGWAIFLNPYREKTEALRESTEFLSLALSIDPSNREAAFRLAQVHAAAGRVAEAQAIAEKLAKLGFPKGRLNDLLERLKGTAEQTSGLAGWFSKKIGS